MADEYGAAGAGAAGGALTGAAVGTMVMPGVGTAVGAGLGAVVGGASGYLGGKGAKKRRKALEAERQKYQRALAQYQATELARSRQREALLQQQSAQANTNFSTYMGQKPGDQTPALQQDAANQSAALYAAQAPTPALAGPLAGQYQQEMDQRVGTAVGGMALDYSADQQQYGDDANRRNYDLAESALSRDRNMFEQSALVGTANSNAALQRAQADYGVGRERASQAGSEQMLYGGIGNALLNAGNTYGSAKRQSALRKQGYGNPALMSNSQVQGMDMRGQSPYIYGAEP